MYLLDTNIFLEILLGQESAEACETVIESLDAKSPGWITSFSLHAIEAIIGRKRENKVLYQFLDFMILHPNLYLYSTSLEEEKEIAKLKINLDFDDSCQYFVAKQKGFSLITLDKDFRVAKDIEVIHPSEFY